MGYEFLGTKTAVFLGPHLVFLRAHTDREKMSSGASSSHKNSSPTRLGLHPYKPTYLIYSFKDLFLQISSQWGLGLQYANSEFIIQSLTQKTKLIAPNKLKWCSNSNFPIHYKCGSTLLCHIQKERKFQR